MPCALCHGTGEMSNTFGSVDVCVVCNGVGSKNKNAAPVCRVCQGKGRLAKDATKVRMGMSHLSICPFCKGEGYEGERTAGFKPIYSDPIKKRKINDT